MQEEYNSSFNEAQLLSKLRQGVVSAFDQLYKNYCLQIHQGFKDFTKTNKGAEELLEEVFIRVWIKRESIKPFIPFWDFVMPIIEEVLREYHTEVNDEKMMDKLLLSAELLLEDFHHKSDILPFKNDEGNIRNDNRLSLGHDDKSTTDKDCEDDPLQGGKD